MDKCITLAITCCDEERSIEKAIESALNSKYITHILISDDWSTDNSINIINEIKRDSSKVKLIRNLERRSLRYNRLNLIHNVETEYVMFLDGDDYIVNIDDIITQCFELGSWDMCYYPIKIDNEINCMNVEYIASKSNEDLSHFCNHYICKTKVFDGINDIIIDNDYISDDQITLYALNHSRFIGTLCEECGWYHYSDGGTLRNLRKYGLE